MEDLLDSQIKESCKLALPNGLKELMADISQEVLRVQPKDLCRFIVEYLSVLLVTRENLSIASRIYSKMCDGCCHEELYEELLNIGLQPDDAQTAKVIIMEYFHSDKVNEGNLFTKLMRKMDLNEELLPAIQEAVRGAFLRHQRSRIVKLESLSDKDIDEVSRAAAHTLQLYSNVDTTNEMYHRMAVKIQTAYRAYGVRRSKYPKEGTIAKDFLGKSEEHFEVPVTADETTTSWNNHKISTSTISSTSLAGSYLKLPKYKPYSAIDSNQLTNHEETSGSENVYVGYATTKEKREKVKIVISEEEKRIHLDEHRSGTIDDDSEGSVEEVIDIDNEFDEMLEDVEEIDKIEVISDTDDEICSIESIETI